MEDFKAMAEALWLTDEVHWDIFLYWLFFINIILLFMMPDGSSTIWTAVEIIVAMAVIIDKTYAFGYIMNPEPTYTPEYCHAKLFIGTYVIRAIMFAGPLMIAGSTDSGKARFLGIIAGLSGATYMFGRWFFDQRDVESTNILCENTQVALASLGMIMVLARAALRDRSVIGRIHRYIPIAVARQLAPHETEV